MKLDSWNRIASTSNSNNNCSYLDIFATIFTSIVRGRYEVGEKETFDVVSKIEMVMILGSNQAKG